MLPGQRRRFLPGDIIAPIHPKGGLVLDAVKAWPGSVGARRTAVQRPALTASRHEARGNIMGRDEETGFSGRTKKQGYFFSFFVRP
jgi:hypothetical protein